MMTDGKQAGYQGKRLSTDLAQAEGVQVSDELAPPDQRAPAPKARAVAV
jgi:hypothetical protein